MFRKIVRIALAATSTVLFVPYVIAFVAELMYGKSSKSHNRFLRALMPKRVYAFNYSLLCELKYLKYVKLLVVWTKFYREATIDRLIKDISYGQNKNTLDVYKPRSSFPFTRSETLKPIIVFLYGGTWSSGDKNVYCLLCTNLADLLNCVVICPNYTLYPKGFVDDMVQDVSDALQWVQNNAVVYGGDKNRVALIGHSAGAHLAALTIGELCKKYLDNNPEYLEETNFPTVDDDGLMEVHVIGDPLPFHEAHFDGTSTRSGSSGGGGGGGGANDGGANDGGASVTGDIIQQQRVTPEPRQISQMVESTFGAGTNSMVIINRDDGNDAGDGDGGAGDGDGGGGGVIGGNIKSSDPINGTSSDENGKNWVKIEGDDDNDEDLHDNDDVTPSSVAEPVTSKTTLTESSFVVLGSGNDAGVKKEDSDGCEGVGTIGDKDVSEDATGDARLLKEEEGQQQQLQERPQQQQQQKQRTLREENMENGNLLKSIRIVIGLAGVYDIEQHYQHQMTKGLENFSNMSRAMYDDVEQFHNFSPVCVIKDLPERVRLPPFHLYHGSDDTSVVITSSLNFGAVLWGRNERTVQVRLLNGCDHLDIMFDLMDRDRLWFCSLMKEFKKGFDKYLY